MRHRNEFGKYYQKHYKTGLGVEVGVQNGYFSVELLKNWKGDLKCVDLWLEPEQEKTSEINLGRDRMIKGDSVKSAELFEDESLDFVFIDAGHRYEEVKADIEAWFPKVRKGGIVSGHDYVKYSDFGVIEAVDEFAKKHNITLEFTETDEWEGYNFISWYFTK
jgi:hypothetical protein